MLRRYHTGFELFSNLKLQTAGGCSEEKVYIF